MPGFVARVLMLTMVLGACKPVDNSSDTKAVVNEAQDKAVGIVRVRPKLVAPAGEDKGSKILQTLASQPLMAVIECNGADAIKTLQSAESTVLAFDVKGDELVSAVSGAPADFEACKKVAVLNFPLLDEFFAVAYTIAKFGDMSGGDDVLKEIDNTSFRMAQLIYLSLRGTYYKDDPTRISQAVSGIGVIENYHLDENAPKKLHNFITNNVALLDQWFNPCDQTGDAQGYAKGDFMSCVNEKGSETAANYLPLFNAKSGYADFEDMTEKFKHHVTYTFSLKSARVIQRVDQDEMDSRSAAVEALNIAIVDYKLGSQFQKKGIPVDEFLAAMSGKGDAAVLEKWFAGDADHQSEQTVVGETINDEEFETAAQDGGDGLNLWGRWGAGNGPLRQWGANRWQARQQLWNSGHRWRSLSLFPQATAANVAANNLRPAFAATCASCAGGRCSSCSACSGGSCSTCPRFG